MFPTSISNHQMLHDARQLELEEAAQKYQLVKALTQSTDASHLRQRVGMMLIELGNKLTQRPQQDVRLVLSARHYS